MRIAFLGFRHGHIVSLYEQVKQDARAQIVATCEDDPATAANIRGEGKIPLTHTHHHEVLEKVQCDAVAIGDTYGNHGPLAIEALRHGKHVIIDKPVCVRLDELAEIERLCQSKKRSMIAMLDMRGSGSARAARRVIRENAIGPVLTITFTAQHPLMLGKRPEWYFEPGQQGGTINDIGIHAFDIIPWITGRQIVETVAARAWNARLPQFPHFQDGAQVMLRLDNNGGVLGDLSYLSPDSYGYQVPQYWRMTFHGSGGVVEFQNKAKSLMLVRSDDKQPQEIPLEKADPLIAWDSFLRETGFMKEPITEMHLTTADSIRAARLSLEIQAVADRKSA